MTSHPVLIALPHAWESEVVARLDQSNRLRVVRRCVDVADLVAAARAGLGEVAVVGGSWPGLDAARVAELAECPVGVVGVVDHDQQDQQATLHRMGIPVVVSRDASCAQLEEAAQSALAASADASVGEADDLPGGRAGAELETDPASRAAGRLIAVWGPAGAPGRSTISLNLAAELARMGVPTMLIDADPYGGVLAAALGLLDETAGLAAAVRAAEQGRLDVERLLRLSADLGSGLRVLTGLPRADRWPELRAAGLEQVLATAGRAAEVIVVDTGFSLEDDEELSYDTAAPRRNVATLTVLAQADDVVVVGAADPIGLQRLVRGLQELQDLNLAGRLLVVVNKVRPEAIGPRPQQRISAVLTRFAGTEPQVFVPEDRAGCDAAMLAGATLAERAPHSPARSQIVELASRIAGSRTGARTRRSRPTLRGAGRARGR